jgi:hypothetical protein
MPNLASPNRRPDLLPQQGEGVNLLRAALRSSHGPGPGLTAHYVAADGRQGVAIADTDDVAGAYRKVQALVDPATSPKRRSGGYWAG